jgi:glycosyltransferase involved in cell wall biosynthesis
MTLHDYWSLCPRGQMLRHDGGVCTHIEHDVCGGCIAATWPHLMPAGAAERTAAAADRTQRALSALAAAQRLIAPSAAVAETYAAAGNEHERIEVVEHGFDVAGLARAVAGARASRPPGNLRLGVLGSVQPSKGVLELAQALVRARVRGLELHVHGALGAYHGDTRYVDALRELAREPELVHGPGAYARADLARILAGLDGVAAPSVWREAWGTTAREARAAGLPVLVSDAGGLPGAAQSGRAGLVVPAGDWSAWERALQRFASDADARARWAREPHAVRDAGAMAADTERVYAAALARS